MEHIWDCIFKTFCGMCESMTKGKNKKLEYLVKQGNRDCRTIIARNIRVICDKWKMCEKQLRNKWKNASLCIFSKQNMMECENNVQMVKDLTNGIIVFNDDEIKDILDYVTTI